MSELLIFPCGSFASEFVGIVLVFDAYVLVRAMFYVRVNFIRVSAKTDDVVQSCDGYIPSRLSGHVRLHD